MKINIVMSFLLFFLCGFILLSCDKKEEPIASFLAEEAEDKNYQKYDIYIPRNGNVFDEMTKIGLTPQQIIELTFVFGNNVDFRGVQPNDHFQVIVDPDTKTVIEFAFLPNIITTHRIVRDFDTETYIYILDEKETITKKVVIEGVVYTTLDRALIDAKIETNVRTVASNALQSRINFSSHTNVGDTFKIMFEERYFEDQAVPGSRLYYVSYNGRRTGFHEGFRYTEPDPASAFNGMYTPTGQSMLIANFRWPLDRIHVTSPFGMRIHPISRRRAMHNGTDYRGATGTPIYAVAAGRVIKAGWDGGFGNTVEIQHDNNYITQYAHMHSIRVRNGARVAAGNVVGTIGSTGNSTGPHLHFGLKINGRWTNPANLRMAATTQLSAPKLEDFKKQIDEIRNALDQLENHGTTSPFEMTTNEKYRRDNAR